MVHSAPHIACTVFMRSASNLVTSIDLGSTTLRGVVGQFLENGNLQVLSVESVPSEGIKRGAIFDADAVIESIGKLSDELSLRVGKPINSVYVGINGTHLQSIVSKGVIAVSRADGKISEEDVDRVKESAQAISLMNKEIIHLVPQSYIVDKEEGIRDPVGMQGIRLELSAVLVYGSSQQLKEVEKCVGAAGLSVENIFFSTLAASRAVLSRKQKDLGVMVMNIGGWTTGICVFEEGNLIYTSVLPIGSTHITNDIAIAFQVPIEVAEKLKIKYGSALPITAQNDEEIDLSEYGDETKRISRRELVDVILARLEEIFDLTSSELRKIGKEKLLPAGAVLCGGGAKLPLLDKFAKERLRIPTIIGFPKNVEGIVDKVDDPAFAAAIGLLLFEKDENDGHMVSRGGKGTVGQIKNWLRNFMP